MARSDRLSHLAYRCTKCRRLLTKLEIISTWEKAEREGVSRGLCPCGGSRISPSNPTLSEELLLPRVWKLWFYEILLPKLGM